MVRKIGQIIRRGPSTWQVRIYVGRDPETRRRKYVGKFIHGGCGPHRPTSTASSRSAISVATSVLPDKPLVSISITGSTSVPDHVCEPRASATTRACLHATSVHIWARDRLGSFRQRKFRSSIATC